MKTSFSASDIQRKCWLTNLQLAEASLPELLMLKFTRPVVNIEALQSSLAQLSKRHESLRTVFFEHEGTLMQDIRDFEHEVFRMETYQIKTKDDEAFVEAACAKGNRQLRDLQRLPLFKTYLFELSDGSHLFILFIHHIISDIPSLSILKDDINSFYAAAVREEEPRIPPLKCQLKDFSEQLLKIQLNGRHSLSSFWKEKFGQLPAHVDWHPAFDTFSRMTGVERPVQQYADKTSVLYALQNGPTAEYGVKFDDQTAAGIKLFSKNNRTGVSSLFYSSLFILLSALTRSARIIIASPISLRGAYPQAAELIANLNAGIYLTGCPDPEESVEAMTTRTYHQFIKAYRRGITDHAIFDFDTDLLRINTLVFMNFQNRNIIGKPAEHNFVEGHRKSGNTYYMLTFDIMEYADVFHCSWYYNSWMFQPGFIEWMAGQHSRIIRLMINEPGLKTGRLTASFAPADLTAQA
ncbi:MAG: condensation domain-containing protein [Mucilaginibacter sp.]|jgi:hypothetical protein|uniref:condensation domain-containing protein n=1 Tax=Mucilaginibacter sp. TaxID=1882438 RepID=UPI003568E710